jgi:hypothetical protein
MPRMNGIITLPLGLSVSCILIGLLSSSSEESGTALKLAEDFYNSIFADVGKRCSN